MYQLTQAMAAGRLQGDEFRSIMENAPLLAQAIAKYMGKTVGELRELSSEGLITADVIKNAMFAAADKIDTRFKNMPRTIGEIWISIKNQAIKYHDPVLVKINEIANSKTFKIFSNNVVGAIAVISSVLLKVFELVMGISNFVTENWSLIAPIVLGIVGAMMAYELVAKGAALATGALTAAKMIAVPVYSLLTRATMAETAAQWGLNAAMYACPLDWIIVLVIGLITAIYGAVAIINHFAGPSIVTGKQIGRAHV